MVSLFLFKKPSFKKILSKNIKKKNVVKLLVRFDEISEKKKKQFISLFVKEADVRPCCIVQCMSRARLNGASNASICGQSFPIKLLSPCNLDFSWLYSFIVKTS